MNEWTATFTPSMGWVVRGCKVKPLTSSHGFVCGLNEEDAKLIADAPLILEAYKRLRLVADELYLHIVGEPHMTLDELIAEMPWRNEE